MILQKTLLIGSVFFVYIVVLSLNDVVVVGIAIVKLVMHSSGENNDMIAKRNLHKFSCFV